MSKEGQRVEGQVVMKAARDCEGTERSFKSALTHDSATSSLGPVSGQSHEHLHILSYLSHSYLVLFFSLQQSLSFWF